MTRRIAGRNDDAAWMASGRCRGLSPSLFFPEDGFGVQLAKSICAECEVALPCLAFALDNGIDDGVWGGTSQRERAWLRRARRRAADGTGVDVLLGLLASHRRRAGGVAPPEADAATRGGATPA